MFDDVDERRKRRRKTKTKTKDENVDRKRTEEGKKKYFKTKLLVPEMTAKEKKRALRSTFLSAILSPTFSQRADATVVRRP